MRKYFRRDFRIPHWLGSMAVFPGADHVRLNTTDPGRYATEVPGVRPGGRPIDGSARDDTCGRSADS
jgi:hypothetical protein